MVLFVTSALGPNLIVRHEPLENNYACLDTAWCKIKDHGPHVSRGSSQGASLGLRLPTIATLLFLIPLAATPELIRDVQNRHDMDNNRGFSAKQ